MKPHTYEMTVTWSDAAGTSDYRSYTRDHTIAGAGKPPISASSDPAFRGDLSRYNPEELLVAALASCHMLWYLHLCADRGIVVTEYRDVATGEMRINAGGSGEFTQVTLAPAVRITNAGDAARAAALHEEAHRLCFIARSVNFPVTVAASLSALDDHAV